MRTQGRVAFGVYGAVTAVHLGAQLLGADAVARWTQWALMPVLAWAFLAAVPVAAARSHPGSSRPSHSPSRLRALVTAGLVFSWFGDTMPHFVGGTVGSTDPGITAFLVLGAMFAVAQALYAVAFWPYRHRSALRGPWVFAYLIAAGVMVALCTPGAGPLLPAVVVYALLIAVMAALATGIHPLSGAGAIAFMASDSIIALNAFAPWWNVPGQGFWVMSTYATAQLLIVLGVVARTRRVES